MPGKWSPSIEDADRHEGEATRRRDRRTPEAAGAADAEGRTGDVQDSSDGFKVELVASEPDVVDPVAMCFDEQGPHVRLRDARLPERRRRHRQRDPRQDQVPR